MQPPVIPSRICVFGAGTFGFVLARHLGLQFQNHRTLRIQLYGRNVEVIRQMRERRIHPIHFPSTSLPPNVCPTSDLTEALEALDLLVLAVPAQSVREAIHTIRAHAHPPLIILNAAKGLELKTHRRLSEVIRECLPWPEDRYAVAVFSGGTIASEMIQDAALGAEIACVDPIVACRLQRWFSNRHLRIYANRDVIGVEYAGALKNVVAIGAGISDGLANPWGTKTLLISRACAEAKRLALKLGAEAHTFSAESQAWSNDLWMSCMGNTRNRYFGELIGRGLSVSEALEQLKREHKIAEGYATAKVAYELARQHRVDAPVLETIYTILYEGKDPRQATVELMTRELKWIQ